MLHPEAPGPQKPKADMEASLPLPSCDFRSGDLDSPPLTLTHSPPADVSPYTFLDLACSQEW